MPILGQYYSMAISLFSVCALRAQFLILSFTETKDSEKDRKRNSFSGNKADITAKLLFSRRICYLAVKLVLSKESLRHIYTRLMFHIH